MKNVAIAALLCLTAFAAQAQEAWWITNEALSSGVIMKPVEGQAHVAEILVINRHTYSGEPNGHLMLEGLRFDFFYESTPNMSYEPRDRVVVTPPPGFIADPAEVWVDEGGTATILIYEALLG